jgi:3-phenylpropionate/trans-cinnamate dioxygenase ferredoxin reductase component
MNVERANVLIAGAGLAGARCAEALRAARHDRRIVILGDEPHPPYERPALSKELLTGARSGPDLLLRDAAYWREHEIELVPGNRVERIDLGAREAITQHRRFTFEHLVLATGLRARRLAAISDGPGVHVLRTLDDAESLRTSLRPGAHLAVVGAGFVGLEVASSAVGLGLRVTVLDPATTPFSSSLGVALGGRLGARARDAGVDLRLGSAAHSVERAPGGALRAVVLSDGTRLACDLLLVGVGAIPNTELVSGQLALAEDGGIATDAAGRTSVPGVYACGDVASRARAEGTGTLRLEHWGAAATSARAVASAIMGAPLPAEGAPFFWSDLFGWRLQAIGLPSGVAAVEIDEDDDGLFARYETGGRLIGAVAINRPRALQLVRRELADASSRLLVA